VDGGPALSCSNDSDCGKPGWVCDRNACVVPMGANCGAEDLALCAAVDAGTSDAG
jgi:hypothetical protein